MKRRSLAVAICALLSVGGSAWADLIFDFSGPATGNVNSNAYSVTQGGFTITAFGFNANNTSHDLYWKKNTGDENGLGLVGTLDNELTLTNNATQIANYIQVDVSQVYQISPTGKIELASTTNGEEYDLFGSNSKGSIGVNILSGGTTESSFISIPDWGSYKYVSVAVHPWPAGSGTGGTPSPHANDNVLFEALTVAPIPEPGTATLVAGAFGLLLTTIRRRKS